MSETLLVGILMVAALAVLVLMKFPVGFAFLLIGFCGYALIRGWDSAFALLPSKVFGGTASYLLSVVPLFILMGELAASTGIGEGLFKTFRAWVGTIKGGLVTSTILANAAFGAASGMPETTTLVFSKVAMPEMLRSKVDRTLTAGCIVGAAGLDALIPPSVIMIIYGFLAVAPIDKCLMAGIVPGLLSVGVYTAMVYVRVRRNPALSPSVTGITWRDRFRSLRDVVGIFAVIVLAIGGILAGLFTPTEGGAVGAAGVLIVALVMRKVTRANFFDALCAAGRATSIIFIMVGGLVFFSAFLSVSGVSTAMTHAISGLHFSPTVVVIITLFMFLGLGCVIGPFPLMYLTIPLIAPIMKSLGVDLIWYGVLAIKVATMGMITPPLGINCYILRMTYPEIPIGEIFKGARWFLLADAVSVALLVAFPQISTLVPNLMR